LVLWFLSLFGKSEGK